MDTITIINSSSSRSTITVTITSTTAAVAASTMEEDNRLSIMCTVWPQRPLQPQSINAIAMARIGNSNEGTYIATKQRSTKQLLLNIRLTNTYLYINLQYGVPFSRRLRSQLYVYKSGNFWNFSRIHKNFNEITRIGQWKKSKNVY